MGSFVESICFLLKHQQSKNMHRSVYQEGQHTAEMFAKGKKVLNLNDKYENKIYGSSIDEKL